MIRPVRFAGLYRWLAATVAVVAAGSCAAGGASQPMPATAMLPDRLLRCELGRATNLDSAKQQTTDDVIYEGRYAFSLFLPAAPVVTTPPPDPIEPADPVDPATRVVADPARLMAGAAPRFSRVVDRWPDRVELVSEQPGGYKLLIVNPIDAGKGTASLFLTNARDAASLDLKSVYQGPCRIVTGAAAVSRF